MIASMVNQGFSDEEMLEDLCREGEFVGAFALLLIFDGVKIDPALVTR